MVVQENEDVLWTVLFYALGKGKLKEYMHIYDIFRKLSGKEVEIQLSGNGSYLDLFSYT